MTKHTVSAKGVNPVWDDTLEVNTAGGLLLFISASVASIASCRADHNLRCENEPSNVCSIMYGCWYLLFNSVCGPLYVLTFTCA